MKDCLITCCFNSGTSLVNGVVIFSVLGYMASEAGLSVEDVAEGKKYKLTYYRQVLKNKLL